MQLSDTPKKTAIVRHIAEIEPIAPVVGRRKVAGKRKLEKRQLVERHEIDAFVPYLAWKANRFVIHTSTDYDQSLPMSVVRDKLSSTSRFQASSDDVKQKIDNILAVSARDEAARKGTSVEAITEGKADVFLRTIANGILNLYQRRLIDRFTYMEFKSALKDISPPPGKEIAENLSRTEMLASKVVPDAVPYGGSILEEEAEAVNKAYRNVGMRQRLEPGLYETAYGADVVGVLLPQTKEQKEQERLIGERTLRGQKRTNFRYGRREGTTLTDTEQARAGERFLGAINMFHTMKEIPIVVTDLIEAYEDYPYLTDVQKERIKEVVFDAKSRYKAKFEEGRRGKSKIYEEVPFDPDIIPARLIEDRLDELVPKREEAVEGEGMVEVEAPKSDTALRGKRGELFYILSNEVGALMAQVFKRWKTRTPDSMDEEMRLYIFGDGVGKFFKLQKPVSRGVRDTIRDEEKRKEISDIEVEGNRLEDEFDQWKQDQVSSKTKFDEAEERRVRIDIPLERYVRERPYMTNKAIYDRIKQTEFDMYDKATKAIVKPTDLEGNAVELNKAWAKARASEMKESGFSRLKSIHSVNTAMAIPFVVNSYMREARLEQAKMLEKAIIEAKKEKGFDEEMLKEWQKLQHLYSSPVTYEEKKKELDSRWMKYRDALYISNSRDAGKIAGGLEKLMSLLSGRDTDKASIKILHDWMKAKPKETITKDDMILPKVDLPSSSMMSYPLSRMRLCDDLKKFREDTEENEKVRELATYISALAVDARTPEDIGHRRSGIDKTLRILRDGYDRKLNETMMLHPEKSTVSSRLLRMRYEDEYVSPDYASDAFGILSLMESGMLKVAKKPSQYLAEYLAAGRALDPANTFPATAEQGTIRSYDSLKTYNVVPSLNQILFEIENIHIPYDSDIEAWAKAVGSNKVIELMDRRTLDNYVADAALRKVEASKPIDVYAAYQQRLEKAKDMLRDYGDLIFNEKDGEFSIKKIFKSVPSGERKEIDEETGKQKVVATYYSIPIFDAMMKEAKKVELADDEKQEIKRLEDYLKRSGIDESNIDDTKRDLRAILVSLNGHEDEFLDEYKHLFEVGKIRKATAGTVAGRTMLARSIRAFLSKAGPYMDEALTIAKIYNPDATEDNALDIVREHMVALLISPKENLTEEDHTIINRMKKLLDGIEKYRESQIVASTMRLVDKETKEIIEPTEEFKQGLAYLARLHGAIVEELIEEKNRVALERLRYAAKLIKEGQSPEDAEEIAKEAVAPAITPRDVFEKSTVYDDFSLLVNQLINAYSILNFMSEFKGNRKLFYDSKIIEAAESKMASEAEAKGEKLSKKELKERTLQFIEKIGIPQITATNKTPADIYNQGCDGFGEILNQYNQSKEVLAMFLSVTPESLEAQAKIDHSKIARICIEALEVKRELSARKEEKHRKKTEERIQTFLGTPLTVYHNKQKEKEAASKFFGIDEYLADKGYAPAS
jgi:hypothetical protein